VGEVLLTIVVLSFIVKRALALLFESPVVPQEGGGEGRLRELP
jgi:hypothetical protein